MADSWGEVCWEVAGSLSGPGLAISRQLLPHSLVSPGPRGESSDNKRSKNIGGGKMDIE